MTALFLLMNYKIRTKFAKTGTNCKEMTEKRYNTRVIVLRGGAERKQVQEEIISSEEIKAMMLVLASLCRQGENIQEILRHSVEYLEHFYNQTGEEQYLKLAKLEILAFLGMGFELPIDKNLNFVLQSGEIEEYIFRYKIGKRVKMNKTQIRAMFGKWKASALTPMTIEQTVQDVLEKASAKQPGIFTYTYRRKDFVEKSRIREERYELIVTQDGSYFWDLNRFRFYILETNQNYDSV